jgi:exosome complex component CSL4
LLTPTTALVVDRRRGVVRNNEAKSSSPVGFDINQGKTHSPKTPSIIVVPGDLISYDQSKSGGFGTFRDSEGCLRASIVGNIIEIKGSISVNPLETRCARIPPTGSTIIGKCVRITQRFVALDIEAIAYDDDETNVVGLVTPLKGTIRLQDIYPVEELEIPVVPNCFRPGDMVKARILGRGEPSAGLLLSTGIDLSLGVIFAANKDGVPLQVISWNQMLDPTTGLLEPRRCAKPFVQSSNSNK